MRRRILFSPGADTLDMRHVDDPTSPWYATVPVPRMVQSQIIHSLESVIQTLDEAVCVKISDHQRLKKEPLPVILLVYFLLLHVREIDAGRNIYWSRFSDPVSIYAVFYSQF